MKSMMKSKKAWMIASLICVGAGIMILIIGRILGGIPGFYIDHTGLHTSAKEETAAPIEGAEVYDEFESVELDIDYADVEFVVSDRFAVEYCLMGEYGDPVCEVKNGKLIMHEAEYRNIKIWNFSFFSGNPWGRDSVSEPDYYVRVEVPKGCKLNQISADIEDGDFTLPEIQAEELTVNNEYGDVQIEEYRGNRLEIAMQDGALLIGTDEAAKTDISSEYGSVEIGRISGGVLQADLQDGSLRIQELDLKKAEIDNEYGDVELGIWGKAGEYGLDLSTEYGVIHIDDGRSSREYGSDEAEYKTIGSSEKNIEVSCEDGNITISHKK